MYNIMPHSSHWFQVHEQKPFEILKQQLEASRNNVTSLAHHDPSVRRLAFADNLYHAEVKAYAPAVISKSFKDMGTYPWNPDRIRKLCQMEATGVTPDAMSIAAELLVSKDARARYRTCQAGQVVHRSFGGSITLNDLNILFFSS